MTKKVKRQISTFLLATQLFFSLFAPFTSFLTSPVWANDGEQSQTLTSTNLEFSSQENGGDHQLHITVQDSSVDTIPYNFFYLYEGVLQAVAGELYTDSENAIYIGTQSADDFIDHDWQQMVFKAEVNGSPRSYRLMKTDDGVDANGWTGGDSLDLSFEEQQWLTWAVDQDSKSAVTNQEVVLHQEYKFPLNEKVSVTFTKLPENSSPLAIREVVLSEELAEKYGTDVAYDITTEMENGSFEFELSLPKPEGLEGDGVEVVYADTEEDLVNDEKVSKVDDERDGEQLIEVDDEEGVVRAKKVEHMTVFVVSGATDSSGNCSIVAVGESGDRCFDTLSEAIQGVTPGETIQVEPGIYHEDTTLVIDKSLIIQGPIDDRAVIINDANPAVTVFSIESSDVSIKNLEITTSKLAPSDHDEIARALIAIPNNSKITNIQIKDNLIFSNYETSIAHKDMFSRGITVGNNGGSNIEISNNIIHTVRNGIVIRNNNSASINYNRVFNTKGGIMNYTSGYTDALNREISNNSWSSTVLGLMDHNEWDIVWNSATYGFPNYDESVINVSKNNNEAYVLDLRREPSSVVANLKNNRSHVFVETDGENTIHQATGNFNEPFVSINYAIGVVAEGGTVFVEEGVYGENVLIDKSLSLIGENRDSTIVSPSSGRVVDISAQSNEIEGLTIQGFTLQSNDNSIVLQSNSNSQTGFDGKNYLYKDLIVDANNNSQTAIGLFDVENITLDNVIVKNSTRADGGALEIIGVKDFTMHNSSVIDNKIGLKVFAISGYQDNSNFHIYDSRFERNDSYAILNEDENLIINATHNWWGHISGPSGESFGDGDRVSANVDFCPWLDSENGQFVESCVANAPTVEIVSPEEDDFVSGEMNVSISAEDEWGIVRYVVRLWESQPYFHNGGVLIDTCSYNPGDSSLGKSSLDSCSFDTTSLDENEKHYITAEYLNIVNKWGRDTVSVNADNTLPTATIDGEVPKSLYNSSTNISVHAIDDNYLKTEFYRIDEESPFKTYTGAWFGLWWLADGDYRMVVIDKASNSTEYEFTIDQTAPTVSDVKLDNELVASTDIRSNNCEAIKNFYPVSGEIDFSAVIEDNLTGVDSAKFNIRKLLSNGCTKSQDYRSKNVTMVKGADDKWSGKFDTTSIPNDGEYTIQLIAIDNSGNETIKYVDILVDNTPPEAPVLLGGSVVYMQSGNVTRSWERSSSDDVVKYIYKSFSSEARANSPDTSPGWMPPATSAVSGQDVYSRTDPTGSSERVFWWRVAAVDGAGNITWSSEIYKVVVDNTAPSSTITTYGTGENDSVTLQNNEETVYTNSWNGDVSGTAADQGGSDLKKVWVSIKNSSDEYWDGSSFVTLGSEETPVNYYQEATGTDNWDYSMGITPTQDTYYIESHAEDQAGNVESTSRLTIVLDKTIPEVDLSINPDPADGDNGWFIARPSITLEATDPSNSGLKSLQYQWNSQAGSWTTVDGENNLAKMTNIQPPSEGRNVLYYRAIDLAGNVGENATSEVGIKNVNWDQTELTDGPLNVKASPNPTSGSTSTISWDKASDNIGISSYKITWDLRDGDDKHSKSVSADTTETTIRDLEEGTYKVTVTAYDNSGHSKSASTDLVINRTAPSAPTLTLESTGEGTATLSWNEVEDADDYIILYGLESGNYIYAARVGNITEYTVEGLTAGSYYFVVRAVDNVDNQSANSNEVATGDILGAAVGSGVGGPAAGFEEVGEVLGDETDQEPTDEKMERALLEAEQEGRVKGAAIDCAGWKTSLPWIVLGLQLLVLMAAELLLRHDTSAIKHVITIGITATAVISYYLLRNGDCFTPGSISMQANKGFWLISLVLSAIARFLGYGFVEVVEK